MEPGVYDERRTPMKNHRLAALAAMVLVVNAGCGGGGGGTAGVDLAAAAVPRASADPSGAVSAATALDAFGLDLYRKLATGSGNVVYSPASVALALSMARAGARGETAA